MLELKIKEILTIKNIDLDGTENKENLGANSILGVSMACTRASAASNYIEEDLALI